MLKEMNNQDFIKRVEYLIETLGIDFVLNCGKDDEDNVEYVEIETWTNGSVNMVIYLESDKLRGTLLSQLKEYIDYFNIDEEIEIYRQYEDYRNDFTISESVDDFTSYLNTMKEFYNMITKTKTYDLANNDKYKDYEVVVIQNEEDTIVDVVLLVDTKEKEISVVEQFVKSWIDEYYAMEDSSDYGSYLCYIDERLLGDKSVTRLNHTTVKA